MVLKRESPQYQIGILFPDGKKISKLKCTLNELFDTYFISLDKYLDSGYSAEQLLELYQKTYHNRGVKIQINYIDSWGHKWKGKEAWPKKDKFLNYLKEKVHK